jgi:hypothetical protein
MLNFTAIQQYVWNAISRDTHGSIMGMRVPLQWACWLEIVLISFITPNVSFMVRDEIHLKTAK